MVIFRANRFSRYLTLAVLAVILVAAMAGAYFFNRLRSSLPLLEGELAAEFVSSPVRVDRDELGTVTITAANRLDAAAALGFCHGQERFFSMDLFRRKAAGELSGLVGPAAIPEDRGSRIHRFRARARESLQSLAPGEKELLDAYVEGVNSGLDALDEYPFEYLLLRQDPVPWEPEDTLLVVYAMYLDLQGDYPQLEAAHGLMRDLLPGPMYDFLAPLGTEWDAPVEGEAFSTPEIPGPEVFSLRDGGASVAGPILGPSREAALSSPSFPLPPAMSAPFGSGDHSGRKHPCFPVPRSGTVFSPQSSSQLQGRLPSGAETTVAGSIPAFLSPPASGTARRERRSPDLQMWQVRSSALYREAALSSPFPPASRSSGYSALQAGSNNWAVSGAHTSHGKPIVANDMHLGLRVPNIWFRASLVVAGPGGEQKVTGVSLPGTPLIIAGSNGKIAWGFTNSQGDWLDLVILEPGPGEGTYLTPDGPRPIERVRERIIASDGTEEILEIEETVWGPVVAADHLGRKMAARWVAYDPEGVNLVIGLESASTVSEAMDIAPLCGLPAQNLTVADIEGNIGWTIIGPIPRRTGYSGRFPHSWASGEIRWDGYLAPGEYPRIVNPPGGRIWTANARVVSGEKLEKVGFGGYALGPRAKQIRDALMDLDDGSEEDLLGVQLDHRAVFLERWRELLLEEVLTPQAVEDRPQLQEVRGLVDNWGGSASPSSAGYRIVREFRNVMAEELFSALTARCREADDGFSYSLVRRDEGPLWKLVTEQPLHLLPIEFVSWDALMMMALEEVIAEAESGLPEGEEPGIRAWTWGERNTAEIRHPLSPFIPSFFSRYLDAPPDQLPGDSRMPRAQGPDMGASQRMVVSPGLEEQGIFHMPGGQSGHPLSPFYLSGHQDWVRGNPTPFLPGEAVYTLVLVPR